MVMEAFPSDIVSFGQVTISAIFNTLQIRWQAYILYNGKLTMNKLQPEQLYDHMLYYKLNYFTRFSI